MKLMPMTLRTGALVASLALAACGAPGQATADAKPPEGAPVSSEAVAAGEPQVIDGWVEVRPEPNVSVQLRDGWSAGRAEKGKGPIIFTGPDKARVVVWPMFVASSAKAPAPEAVLIDFAKKEGSPLKWGRPSPLGDTGVRMFGESGDITAQASFVYAKTKVGMVGYWYLTSAPRAKYAELRPVFSGLMKGVRISGTAAGQAAAPAPLTYTSWREPNEAAYTTEVPKAWRVTGGVIRPATLRLLDIVEMTSPDGKAYAFSGDPNLPLYKTPTQMEAQIGLVEGMRNGEAVLMRYRAAVELIPGFVQQRLGRRCAGLKLGKVEADERLTTEANRALQASTMPGQVQRMDVATAEFACGDDMVGVVQMATYLTGVAPQYGVEGFGIWSVAGVAGIVAPGDRAVETGQALIHMLQSRKVNPVWSRANAEMVAQINTISQQAANDMSARIASRYSPSSGASTSSGAMSDDLSRQWQNSTMDQTDVIDQATGQSYKVDSGSSYYWINGQGTAIAGTNTPSQPSVDFNLMTQLP
jgi:hypothetical protein